MSSDPRATRAAAEISRINAFFPIMTLLGTSMAVNRPFEGKTIAVSAHLTTLTGALVRELALGGGEWVICSVNHATTDHGVVAMLRSNNITVYTLGNREDAYRQALDHRPDLIADVGADIVSTLLRERTDLIEHIQGAVEVTRSGLHVLRRFDSLPFGVININDGVLKPAIENRHGVGEGLWQSVQALTGMHLSGRRIGVVGYGPVGKGVAAYARAAGATVEVVEPSPVRQLIAHYDGFPTPTIDDCLKRVGIIVTCTGKPASITVDMLRSARNGLVLINAGHGDDEIDVAGIRANATAGDEVADHVVRYSLSDGPTVALLAQGHPLNIVTNSGSPEPVLLHFALLGLTLEWLAKNPLPAGEQAIPEGLEERAAALALQALGAAHG
ncbi:MAG: NAD(P)-dependent oxidoreductase [Myxococcota bacterium]|nr:NAD(P)-dependent oxidoreductase [Myxococcota bacterium]MEC9388700.1 NAD(P)-dependent oxidoreductase [Myxococcota bacterium]